MMNTVSPLHSEKLQEKLREQATLPVCLGGQVQAVQVNKTGKERARAKDPSPRLP